jgi:phenylalanyl-tRNA synthetase beta chain
MRVSWKWLQEWLDLSGQTPQSVAELLTRRGLEVEEVLPQAQGWGKVITARLLERQPHPQADRLSLCKVSLGSGEPLEIVCGAQNMKAGDSVVLAQVGAKLPNGLSIAQSKIRGVVSNGMLCSEAELGLAPESEGILILPPDTPPGRSLAEFMGRDDVILVLKLTANRGDCLSHLGLAREIASALGRPLRRGGLGSERFQKLHLELGEGKLAASTIQPSLDAGEDAPQFWGLEIRGVRVQESPAWVKSRLEAVGQRSINSVVDATNYVLLELGQPLHAYDADRLVGKRIAVRTAREGERLPLLDGVEVTLLGTELIIADSAESSAGGTSRPIGLAGVMGGGNSEVRPETTRVFLEAAEFSARRVRRAASAHQRRTEAAQRFEKGIDPELTGQALIRLAELIVEWSGGEIVGGGVALAPGRRPLGKMKRAPILLSEAFIQGHLGMPALSSEEIERILKGQGCEIKKTGTDSWVIPPSHRWDLNLREDLSEEVARSLGYDQIPSTLPPLTTAPTAVLADPVMGQFAQIDRLKDVLARQGLLETVQFSFTDRAWLERLGFQSTARVLNPLSEELEMLVPSLLPGLLQAALHNQNHHFGSESLTVRLFQVRPTFHVPPAGKIAAQGETETGVEERWKLAFLIAGPRYASGLKADLEPCGFEDVRGILQSVEEELSLRGVRPSALTASRAPEAAGVRVLHPGRGFEILAGNQVAGTLGQLHPRLARELKFRSDVWLCELDLGILFKMARPATEARSFKAWPQFPQMERDFALLVRNEVSAEKLTSIAVKAGKPIAKNAKVFDIYRGPQVPEGMTSVAVRVIFFEEQRSLHESEAEAASAKILEAWKKELSIELRS